jgi:hypothetical protein
MTDLLETPERLSTAVIKALDQFERDSDQGCSYKACERLSYALERLGYKFDYDLDGEPYDLREEQNQ